MFSSFACLWRHKISRRPRAYAYQWPFGVIGAFERKKSLVNLVYPILKVHLSILRHVLMLNQLIPKPGCIHNLCLAQWNIYNEVLTSRVPKETDNWFGFTVKQTQQGETGFQKFSINQGLKKRDVYKTWTGVHGAPHRPGPWTTPNFQKEIAPVNTKIFRSGYEKHRLTFLRSWGFVS